MKKKDALEDLWRNLEETPVPDNAEARQKKLAALMANLPSAAGAAPAAAASKGFAAGWGRAVLRYAWVPLAAAACIAAVILLRTSAQPAPELLADAELTSLTLNTDATVPAAAPQLLAEATPVATPAPTIPAASPATPAMCKTAPECTRDPEKTASHVQNAPDLHTATSEPAPTAAPGAIASEPQSAAPTTDPFAEAPAAASLDAFPADPSERPRRNRTLAFSLFAAGSAGSSVTNQIIDLNKIAFNPGTYLGTVFDLYTEAGPVAAPPVTIGNRHGIYLHHDMPINLGMSLAYTIIGRFALESGITYSYLHSDITEAETNYDRQLHYIGVPLALQYKVVDRPRFSAYVSGGGSVAYCLGGKLDRIGGSSVTINDHPKQTALTVSAGADYRIAGPFCFFGEVACNRYFDDGTSLDTYYSANPWAPSFKAGVRFQINKKN